MVSEQTNVRQAWKVIDRVLCREKTDVNDGPLSADDFATFFEKKIFGTYPSLRRRIKEFRLHKGITHTQIMRIFIIK